MYNQGTGWYNLTYTQASRWIGEGMYEGNPLERAYYLLRAAGYPMEDAIFQDGGRHFRVKATPGQVWEALSGMPSDWERERVHYHKDAEFPAHNIDDDC